MRLRIRRRRPITISFPSYTGDKDTLVQHIRDEIIKAQRCRCSENSTRNCPIHGLGSA